MGLSVSTVSQLLLDPTGEREKARKKKYLNSCRDCNAPCHGERCERCAGQNVWSEERIIEAIQEWELEHGRTPYHWEWESSGEFYPSSTTVTRVFSSWNAAM